MVPSMNLSAYDFKVTVHRALRITGETQIGIHVFLPKCSFTVYFNLRKKFTFSKKMGKFLLNSDLFKFCWYFSPFLKLL